MLSNAIFAMPSLPLSPPIFITDLCTSFNLHRSLQFFSLSFSSVPTILMSVLYSVPILWARFFSIKSWIYNLVRVCSSSRFDCPKTKHTFIFAQMRSEKKGKLAKTHTHTDKAKSFIFLILVHCYLLLCVRACVFRFVFLALGSSKFFDVQK